MESVPNYTFVYVYMYILLFCGEIGDIRTLQKLRSFDAFKLTSVFLL